MLVLLDCALSASCRHLISLQRLRGSRDVLRLNLNSQTGTLKLNCDQRGWSHVSRHNCYESSDSGLIVDVDRLAISGIGS